MNFTLNQKVKERFPELYVAFGLISELSNNQKGSFEEKKELVYNRLVEKYSLENLKDIKIFRAYRDFFWALGIDPTKIRPASEALIRRFLNGKPIPRINCIVDAYNLASMESGIALAAFNADLLKGDLIMRFANEGEKFFGIGMKEPKDLQGNELIVSDEEQIIAIYPHRDAENTKVKNNTTNIFLLVCGVPGIKKDLLISTAELAIDYITQLCGGKGSYQISE